METLFLSVLLIGLIILSGFFSASETALFSLSPMKIKTYQSHADRRKQLIAHLLHQSRDLLVTVFMLNTLVNILIQNVASSMFGFAASWTLKVGVPLLITLIFGEIIPKYIGLQNNTSLAYAVAPTISFLQTLLGPVRRFVTEITAPISRILFFYLKKEQSISKDELDHVLKQSKEHGVLPPEQAQLVAGYLDFQEATVKEVMRPREDMLFYDIQDPLTKLTHLFVEEQCSRLPVCEGNIQNVLGIITVKEFFLHREAIQSSNNILPFVDKPFFVPEATPARMLLRRMDELDQEIAIVVDEYGSITGLVAYEDIVEVVVGNISDLRDRKPLYTKAGKHEIIASGKFELSDFNELFETNLTSNSGMVTLGGWLTEQCGDIPKSGSKIESHNFLFQILAADPNRIRRIYVRKLPLSNKVQR